MFKRFKAFFVVGCLATTALHARIESVVITLAEGCYLAHEFERAFKKAKSATHSISNSTHGTIDNNVIQKQDKDQVLHLYPKLTRLEFAKRPDVIKKYARTKYVGASLLATLGGITYFELIKKRPSAQPRNNDSQSCNPDQQQSRRNRSQSTQHQEAFVLNSDSDSNADTADEMLSEEESGSEQSLTEAAATTEPNSRVTTESLEQLLCELTLTQNPAEQQTKIIETQILCTKYIIENDFFKLNDLEALQHRYPEFGRIFADLIELRKTPNMLERARSFILTDCKNSFNISLCGSVQQYLFRKLVVDGNMVNMLIIETDKRFESYTLYEDINKPIKGWFGIIKGYGYSTDAWRHLEKEDLFRGILDMNLEDFIEYIQSPHVLNVHYKLSVDEQRLVDELMTMAHEFIEAEKAALIHEEKEVAARRARPLSFVEADKERSDLFTRKILEKLGLQAPDRIITKFVARLITAANAIEPSGDLTQKLVVEIRDTIKTLGNVLTNLI